MNLEPGSFTTVLSTSDASPFVEGVQRPLTYAETALLTVLVEKLPQGAELKSQLQHARVQPMKDGAMGSLRFVSERNDRKSSELIEAKSVDVDGTVLEIAVNVDQDGKLFELDMWKVDFSPLIRIPDPAQVSLD